MNYSKKMWALLKVLGLTLLMSFTFIACDDDDDELDETRRFTVTLRNASSNTTLQAGALPDRTVPLSAGVWAVYDDDDEWLFRVNNASNISTERLAEEGMPDEKHNELSGLSWIDDNGKFSAPGGADNASTIGIGESITFTFEADPGDKLQIMTMFGQSNDWFYAFDDDGLELFDSDDDPIDGNITSEVVLYDAGTEVDETPGLGTTQKPDHLNSINVGPADAVNEIRNAMTRHTSLLIPAINAVIEVTITSVDAP